MTRDHIYVESYRQMDAGGSIGDTSDVIEDAWQLHPVQHAIGSIGQDPLSNKLGILRGYLECKRQERRMRAGKVTVKTHVC